MGFHRCEHSKDQNRLVSGSIWTKEPPRSSVVFVVCADEKRAAESYGGRGKTLYCIQDTAAAIQNILLTACSMGLGTCWIGAFKEDEVRKVVNAPKNMRPVALIPVGYPNEEPKARPRRPLNGIMWKETF